MVWCDPRACLLKRRVYHCTLTPASIDMQTGCSTKDDAGDLLDPRRSQVRKHVAFAV
jgi:hypothetical protein